MSQSAMERAWGQLRYAKSAGSHQADVTVRGIRHVGESGVVGAILGAIHASSKTGLDVTAPGAAAGGTKVPVDAALGVAAFIGGVMNADRDDPSGPSQTMMGASAACAAVFMFRQTNDFVAKLNIKKSGVTAGGGAALPNAQIAASQPGVISKATFAGDGARAWGSGFHPASVGMHGEDRIATLARGL